MAIIYLRGIIFEDFFKIIRPRSGEYGGWGSNL
jgi:hypothetical protein